MTVTAQPTNFWSWAILTPIIVMLASGTVSSLANKVVYDTPIEGTCGKNKFQKAYGFTLLMFIGEAMCLVVYFVKEHFRKKREAEGHYAALLSSGPSSSGPHPSLGAVNRMRQTGGHGGSFDGVSSAPEGPLTPVMSSAGMGSGLVIAAKKPPIWIYAILCVFDLSATAVGGVGLIWVDASTNQMLRGSMVVFCAIFSVMLLNRKLSRGQWGSIGLVCVGLALVGMSGMLQKHFEDADEDSASDVSSSQMLMGIFLVLLASALNAIQGVFEEKLLKAVGGAEVDPLELVGWEGVFGTILSAAVLLPIVHHIPGDDCGKVEDTMNTLEQLKNSGLAVGLSISYIIGLMLMNWTSQQISQQLSSVHRNLVSASRTVLVWVGSLILYYATPNSVDDKGKRLYGEAWTNWSLVEMAGFLVLVGGTVLYSYAGILQAKQQALEEELKGETAASPEYVLPIEPALYEHPVIAKQQSFAERTAHGNGYHSVE